MASRICHDLSNPIGALANAVELLGPDPADPEVRALLAQSAAAATDRLEALRIAFGRPGGGVLDAARLARLAAVLAPAPRLGLRCTLAGSLPRAAARRVLLGVLALVPLAERGAALEILPAPPPATARLSLSPPRADAAPPLPPAGPAPGAETAAAWLLAALGASEAPVTAAMEAGRIVLTL